MRAANRQLVGAAAAAVAVSACLTVHYLLNTQPAENVRALRVPSAIPVTDVLLAVGGMPPPASPAALGASWAHTLPPDIARSAVWFDKERTLDDVFAETTHEQVVWVTFTNTAFFKLAMNWAAHVYRLRKERQVVIAALDTQVRRLLLAQHLPCFSFASDAEGDVRQNSEVFRRMGALKAALVLRVLNAGRHALVSDVDVVWLADPEFYFVSAIPSADIGAQHYPLFISGYHMYLIASS